MRLRHGFVLCLAAPLIMAMGHDLIAQMSFQEPRENPRDAMRRMGLYDEDPMTGTWDLNISKSKFNPGPALRSAKVMTEIHGSSFKCVIDSVDSEGRARRGEWTANVDGRDYPARMSPFADSIALNRIDSDTIEAVYKRAGKPILTERLIFSKDRKTLTMGQTGQGLDNSLVYNRE
jgi:hypothetical protein